MSGQNNSFTLPAADADALLSAHDGDVALLYLYILRTGSRDISSAARVLCRTMAEMRAAEEKLDRLLSAHSRSEDEPSDELPEYTAKDISTRSMEDKDFRAVVEEAKRVFGHSLSDEDLKKLFGIYDHLGLRADVIYVLLNHCKAQNASLYGNERRLTMRYVEKEAFAWVNREVVTLEQAEEYAQHSAELLTRVGSVSNLLGLADRKLVKAELEYISSWLDMGFDDELISMAYEKTVLNTGSLKWPYMNKILSSWHKDGIHTAKDVAGRDNRYTPGAKTVDMNELNKVLDKI